MAYLSLTHRLLELTQLARNDNGGILSPEEKDFLEKEFDFGYISSKGLRIVKSFVLHSGLPDRLDDVIKGSRLVFPDFKPPEPSKVSHRHLHVDIFLLIIHLIVSLVLRLFRGENTLLDDSKQGNTIK